MPVTRTYENVCLPLQKLFILSYIVLWYFCFVTLFHFVTYCVTFTLFDCRKNIISASVNLLAILLLCSLAVIVGDVDTSLPISERNSRFKRLRFTEEWKDCSSVKMEDLHSEEMLVVIDSVLITMPKNVICVVGGTAFSGFIGTLIC